MDRKQSNDRTDVYERVTAQVTAQLEAGTVPWHRPWATSGAFPRSMATGKTYRGINAFLLGFAGHASPWWGTYRQIQEQGGQVRKGERATVVLLWRPLACKEHRAEPCKECGNARLARGFSVFNAGQANNLPAVYGAPMIDVRDHEPIEAAEAVTAGYLAAGPALALGGDVASYAPREDIVRMPRPEVFESGDAYFSTLFHELTHSTGHASRLARKELLEFHRFGDANYSREELTAEMGAAFLSALVGIEQATIPASAAYIAHWLGAFRNDPRMLASAAADAQRAVDLIVLARAEEVAA